MPAPLQGLPQKGSSPCGRRRRPLPNAPQHKRMHICKNGPAPQRNSQGRRSAVCTHIHPAQFPISRPDPNPKNYTREQAIQHRHRPTTHPAHTHPYPTPLSTPAHTSSPIVRTSRLHKSDHAAGPEEPHTRPNHTHAMVGLRLLWLLLPPMRPPARHARLPRVRLFQCLHHLLGALWFGVIRLKGVWGEYRSVRLIVITGCHTNQNAWVGHIDEGGRLAPTQTHPNPPHPNPHHTHTENPTPGELTDRLRTYLSMHLSHSMYCGSHVPSPPRAWMRATQPCRCRCGGICG